MTGIVSAILTKCHFDACSTVDEIEEARLKAMVKKNFSNVKIDKVQKLSNKFLYASFMLKKSEKEDYHVEELIHSTAVGNISSIEKSNLNWRLVERAKYGNGVSFSENADYANFHGTKKNGSRRAFIICDVLVDKVKTVPDNSNDAPDGDFDTYRSEDEFVFVKFDDFTFYPKYALLYNTPPFTTSRFYASTSKSTNTSTSRSTYYSRGYDYDYDFWGSYRSRELDYDDDREYSYYDDHFYDDYD